MQLSLIISLPRCKVKTCAARTPRGLRGFCLASHSASMQNRPEDIRRPMKRILHFLHRYLLALLASMYLFTLGVFAARHRSFLQRICGHFGWEPGSPPRRLPVIDHEELTQGDLAIRIMASAGVDGNVSHLELLILDNLIRKHDPQGLFEIGTFDGRTTLNLAANAGDHARVITLDLPPDAQQTDLPTAQGDSVYFNTRRQLRFAGTPWQARIQTLFGDSATFDFSPWFGRMDFVFIDGAHTYEYVLSDTDRAMRLLRNRKGIIAWHDYGTWNGVTLALNELQARGGEYSGIQQIRDTTLAILAL